MSDPNPFARPRKEDERFETVLRTSKAPAGAQDEELLTHALTSDIWREPPRYRCHLGCILLRYIRTAAISLLTGDWSQEVRETGDEFGREGERVRVGTRVEGGTEATAVLWYQSQAAKL